MDWITKTKCLSFTTACNLQEKQHPNPGKPSKGISQTDPDGSTLEVHRFHAEMNIPNTFKYLENNLICIQTCQN